MRVSPFPLFLFLVIMFGNTADAQCLKCVPVTWTYGTCDEA